MHGESALDLVRALITGLISLQIANDPGGDRWARLQDDALEMFFAHYLGPRPNGGRATRARGKRQ